MSYDGEAEAYIEVEFRIMEGEHQVKILHKASCSIGAMIGHLKEDMAKEFKTPASLQVWSHTDQKNHKVLMDDSKQLMEYLRPAHLENRIRMIITVSN